MDILLSIRPNYAELILSGEKKFEFRRRIFKNSDIETVYLYSNSEVRKITGGFEVGEIHAGTPHDLWKRCSAQGGVDKEFFFQYFVNCDLGYAIEIADVKFVTPHLDPYEEFDAFTPPQSFYYLSEKQSTYISSRLLQT